MPAINVDIDGVFLASENNRLQLKGISLDGEVVDLLDPRDLAPGATGVAIGVNSLTTIGTSLYFVAQVQTGTSISSSVYRLTQDGEVQQIAGLPGLGLVGVDFVADPLDLAMATDGNYVVMMIGAESRSQYYSISPDGAVEQITNFVRAGYPGALYGIAAVGDTLFYRGNQQTPAGTEELYRQTASGRETIVFNSATDTVFDMEQLGGNLWFASRVVDPENYIAKLWRVGESGAAVQVDLGERINPVLLDGDIPGAGLALFYYQTDEFDEFVGSGMMRINADGTTSDILPLGSNYEVMDTVAFNGALYFMGQSAGDGATRLFRVGPKGNVTEISGFGNGVIDPNVHDLSAQDDRLLFAGDMMVSDGFGGQELTSEVLYALGKDGVVEVIAGAPGHEPTLITLETFEFSIDAADPILGTPGDDVRNGTNRSEVISVMTGNDTVRARNGQDTVLGGDGNDRLSGEAGNDSLSGGAGTDVLVGGIGDDSLFGNSGNDTAFGGDGADYLNGSVGDDLLDGGIAADLLAGGSGIDTLKGGDGADSLLGGSEADVLVGGEGEDVLTGGAGSDVFLFDDGRDRILDFQGNVDTIRLSQALWGGGLRVGEVLSTFARFTSNGVILDFGAEELVIQGAPSISALLDDLVLIA